jgi:hypothetical protein
VQRYAAEFPYIWFLKGCIGGDFRNTRTTAEGAARVQQVAKLHKEKKRNHEDDKAGDAGNDNRGGPVHPDS